MADNQLIFKRSLDYPDLYCIGDKPLSRDPNDFNFIHNAKDNFEAGFKETMKVIANVTLWLTSPGSIAGSLAPFREMRQRSSPD